MNLTFAKKKLAKNQTNEKTKIGQKYHALIVHNNRLRGNWIVSARLFIHSPYSVIFVIFHEAETATVPRSVMSALCHTVLDIDLPSDAANIAGHDNNAIADMRSQYDYCIIIKIIR